MPKIYKLFLILFSRKKVCRLRINALKLMGNWYNLFIKDPYTLIKKFMIKLSYLETWIEKFKLL